MAYLGFLIVGNYYFTWSSHGWVLRSNSRSSSEGKYYELTHATLSAGLACVSRGTDAHVCTNQVLTGHASVGTVIYAIFTLILVWKSKERTMYKIYSYEVCLCVCTLTEWLYHRSYTFKHIGLKVTAQSRLRCSVSMHVVGGLMVCLELECKHHATDTERFLLSLCFPPNTTVAMVLKLSECRGVNSDSAGYSIH